MAWVLAKKIAQVREETDVVNNPGLSVRENPDAVIPI